MDDSFELFDPDAARNFLAGFPAQTRQQGESCWWRGGIKDLAAVTAGYIYTANVSMDDAAPACKVQLNYFPERGWSGQCSCHEGDRCVHIAAAMTALLSEHRTATVRGLSSGQKTSLTKLAVAKARPETAKAGSLATQLVAALGRPLEREELAYIKTIHQVYSRCVELRRISYWDLHQMGFALQGSSWDALDIWPAFPKSELDFWLYVAYAARNYGLPIPPFMEPVTDFTAVEKQIADWERQRQIETWNKAIGDFLQRPLAEIGPAGETDLRIVIREDDFAVEWMRPGRAGFEPLKATPFKQLLDRDDDPNVRLTEEARLIREIIMAQQIYYSHRPSYDYEDDEGGKILSRILRLRMLDSRVVTPDGQPLARPEEPLRWQLSEAASEAEDYTLRLVQADGSPVPPLLCSIEGSPKLYLTARAVFAGPEDLGDKFDLSQEIRVPAPVVEQGSGVAFLRTLGVPLPARLNERVQLLPFEIKIHCSLRPTYRGSEAEECKVEVTAYAPDGYTLLWDGQEWQPRVKQPRKKPKADGPIQVHDLASLARVPMLLEPLALKSAPRYYGYPRSPDLTARVTKKFPEIFAGWLKTLPPDIKLELEGDLLTIANADVAGTVKLDVTEAEIDWFDLRVVLNVNDTTLTPAEIKLLMNAKGGYVRLKGKGWRRLQYNLTEEENDRLARLGLSPREMSAEPQRLHALQLADDAAKKFLPEQQVAQVQRRASEIKARVNPPLPAGITAQLRPYQLEGFHFLAYLSANRFGGILADDMGLGKTLQTLAWLLWLRGEPAPASVRKGTNASGQQTLELVTAPPAPEKVANPSESPKDKVPRTDIPPSLVVCPKSVMDNWHAEAAKFAPQLRVKVWSGTDLGRFMPELKSADVHVLNYSQLRNLGESLAPVRWQTVILDEGQYIKNPSSQTAQVARALRAEHRLILTGTPIENRLLDLWSLMAFAMPGILSSRGQFAKLYDAKGDPFARRRLSARVRPFVLRRTKAQVARDLPDRIEEDLFCEIEGEQKTLYRAELKRAQQLLLSIKTQKELAQHQFHFLTSLLRLRQVCCDPRLVKPDSTAPSAKAEALVEQLEPLMEEGQKVLVFSQFVELLKLLKPLLAERNWQQFYLAGETENRGELVRDFQSAEGAAVFLISLKAGGFGLNLTAASYVVLFDPWWNPAVENQAIDRTHRIGQTNKVIAYRLLIKNSIEEKIRELQKQKKALAEDVLGEEKFAQSLTLNDLQFLFSD